LREQRHRAQHDEEREERHRALQRDALAKQQAREHERDEKARECEDPVLLGALLHG